VDKEAFLLECIRNGNQAEAQKVLNEILGYVFFTSGRDIDVIKARVMELAVLLSRAALQGGADNEQIFGINFRYLQQLYTMKEVDDIAFGLSRIMRRFTDCVFILKDVKHVDVIQRSIAYIKKHHQERIPLEEISAHVSLSPTYFSRLFKEEMRTTFTEFLNRYRITKAKSLLVNSRIPLVDVAGLVGFEDQSYFTKVFNFLDYFPGKSFFVIRVGYEFFRKFPEITNICQLTFHKEPVGSINAYGKNIALPDLLIINFLIFLWHRRKKSRQPGVHIHSGCNKEEYQQHKCDICQ